MLLSTCLWLALASLYSYYLNFSDYTRFYAGLSQLMVALIFFQMTAVDRHPRRRAQSRHLRIEAARAPTGIERVANGGAVPAS